MKMQKLLLPAITLAMAVNIAPVLAAHGDVASDRVNDHASDQANDRTTDRANDRAHDRAHDRATDRKRHNNLRKKVARIFNALDTDENGSITLDEFLANLVEKAEKQFDRIDTDDDSLISLEEFLAVHDDDRHNTDVEAVRARLEAFVESTNPASLEESEK